jgi:hypothetical protein
MPRTPPEAAPIENGDISSAACPEAVSPPRSKASRASGACRRWRDPREPRPIPLDRPSPGDDQRAKVRPLKPRPSKMATLPARLLHPSCKLSIFFLVCHHGTKCNNWCRTKQLNLLLEIGKSENQDLQSSPSCCSLMPKRAFGNQEIKTTQLLQPQVEKFLMTPFIRTYK